jgi:alkylhydroperoxidase family enzyme
VDERVRATLRALARLTVDPEHFGQDDLVEARAAGVSDAALADAVAVCALFNVATRCADALGFDPTTASPHALVRLGYRPPAPPG